MEENKLNQQETEQPIQPELEQEDDAGSTGPTIDLSKIVMTGLGAIVHAKEKSVKWLEEMQAKGQASSGDMQPMLDEWEKKGRDALEQGKAMSADAVTKLQSVIDNLKTEAKQLGIDDIQASLEGLTDDALTTLKAKIEELLGSRNKTEE